MKWTKGQSDVITSRGGDLLVSAAAGSGKTAVLVERIIRMVLGDESEDGASCGIDIDELLVVTFTRAAASQMKEKIEAALEKKVEERPFDEHLIKQLSLIHRADITTIDSLCLNIVKENFNVVGLDSSFSIGDPGELELLAGDVMKDYMEELYGSGDSDFYDLVDCFSRKHSDMAVENMIRDVVKVADSYPDPKRWYRNALKALEINTVEELDETPWMKDYLENVNNTLKSVVLDIRGYIDMCNLPGGPYTYEGTLLEDIGLIESVGCVKSVSRLAGRDIKFPRMARKPADSDPDIVDYITKGRKKYKDTVTGLFLKKDVDTILLEQKYIGNLMSTLVRIADGYRDRLLEAKRDKNIFDFSDIAQFALSVVCDGYDSEGNCIPSVVGNRISEQYREIFIDEYQDSNFLQEDIIKCISGHGEGIDNMFMVGDVKQSIYRFRMARPDLFIKKYNTYGAPGDEDHKRILLSNNFRSSEIILNTVNSIFAGIMGADLGEIEYDESASLKPGLIRPELNRDTYRSELLLIDMDDKEAETGSVTGTLDKNETEAVAIARKIKEIVDGPDPLMVTDGEDEQGNTLFRKVRYGDIAILRRGVKDISTTYDYVFEEYGIPLYQESDNGYFDATEIRVLLSMLAVIDNAHLDYELAAVLRSPIGNMDSNELALVVGSYRRDMEAADAGSGETENTGLGEAGHTGSVEVTYRNADLYDKICSYVNLHNDDTAAKLAGFLDLLLYLKEHKNYMSISEIINYVLDKTGYYWYVGAMRAGKKRQANIDMLIDKADKYEDSIYKGLFNFIRYMERLKVNEVDFAEANVISDEDDVVRLMTMHKSKGLEYKVVFVSGLHKKLMNLDARKPVYVHPDYYLACHAIDPVKRIKQKDTFMRSAFVQSMTREYYSEEMRILYVALTRAKEKLYMTGCVKGAYGYLEAMSRTAKDPEGHISYLSKLSAGSYLDWILMARSDIAALDSHEDGNISIKVLKARDIVTERDFRAVKNIAERSELIDTDNIDQDIYNEIKGSVDFKYPYANSNIKSKLSVTEIKRMKNRGEENEGTELRFSDKTANAEGEDKSSDKIEKTEGEDKASDKIVREGKIKGSDIGTAMHKCMELLDLDRGSRKEVQAQVDGFFELGIFDEELRPYISIYRLSRMLCSDLGRRMAAAGERGELYREQQFYYGVKAGDIYGRNCGDADEMILVQGIIDAYFIEDGGLVIIDYKTDRVDSLEKLKDMYHVQLDMYADIISKLTALPVKEKVLYSFNLNDSISFG